MYLGGACCSAAAIASCPSAQKDDDVSRVRIFPDHAASGGCSHNCADFHTLCHIIRVIQFFDVTGCQSDLVSVRRISACGASYQSLLGKLSFQGLGNGYRRVCRTCHTHCLVNIASSGKRISDRTAQTGCRTSEGFDLCRMVMGLVLKEYQPLLRHRPVAIIDLDRHHNGAGIDLIRFLHILQLAIFFQFSHSHQRQIHQADKFVLSSLKDLISGIQIALICGFNGLSVIALLKFNLLKLGGKSGMAAMIRPVGI